MKKKYMNYEKNEDKKKRKSCYKVFCENLYFPLFFILFRIMLYDTAINIAQIFNAAFLIVTIGSICLLRKGSRP